MMMKIDVLEGMPRMTVVMNEWVILLPRGVSRGSEVVDSVPTVYALYSSVDNQSIYILMIPRACRIGTEPRRHSSSFHFRPQLLTMDNQNHLNHLRGKC
jgi:hypothetical protein